MDDRYKLIKLIGRYGNLCADTQGTTPADRIAAMCAIEDFCDAAILAEREACKAIVSRAKYASDAVQWIDERPAP